MNILVRNLSRAVTEKELLQIFLQFGGVKSANIVMDEATGDSKGFGFVDMPDHKEAIRAIKALNNKFINGEKVRVKTSAKPSHPPSDKKPARVRPGSPDSRETKTAHRGKSSVPRARHQRPK